MTLEHIILPIFFLGGVIFISFCFIEFLLWHNEEECECEFKTTLDSYHKQVCIDCGKEFKYEE